MTLETTIKPEPADSGTYSSLVVARSSANTTRGIKRGRDNDDDTVRETIEANAVVKEEPMTDNIQIKKEPRDDPELAPYPGSTEEAEQRKRARASPRVSSSTRAKKVKVEHEVVDLTEEELLAEAWGMAREASSAPVAESLRRMEANHQQRELDNLKIDMKAKWYKPSTFFSRPERISERIQARSAGNPLPGQVIHPAIRDADGNQYRRSERRIQKYMAEAYGSSRVGKTTKQTKLASTIGRKLTEKQLEKSIADGTAQVVASKAAVEPMLDDGTHCTCGEARDTTAIFCDNKDCERGWYHLECVGLQEIPKGKWVCVYCKTPSVNNANGRTLKSTTLSPRHNLPQVGKEGTTTPTSSHRQKLPSAQRTMPATRPRPVIRPRPFKRAQSEGPSTGLSLPIRPGNSAKAYRGSGAKSVVG